MNIQRQLAGTPVNFLYGMGIQQVESGFQKRSQWRFARAVRYRHAGCQGQCARADVALAKLDGLLVVRLTGPGEGMAREIRTEAGVLPVKFETGAAATVAQLPAPKDLM